MTLISPGDWALQCGMWLWNHGSEFTKWQHPAMWYVALGWHAVEFARWQHHAIWHIALGSWHWICQVAVPCNVAGGSGMTRHVIRPNVRHIGIHILFRLWPYHRSRHVILHQSVKFYPNRTTHGRKITSCRFSRWQISAVMDFRGRINGIMGSLRSPCATSYRSCIETIGLLSFWENCVFFILAPGRLTEKHTAKRIGRPIALSRCRYRKRRLSKLRVTFTQDDRRASKILWYDGIESSI